VLVGESRTDSAQDGRSFLLAALLSPEHFMFRGGPRRADLDFACALTSARDRHLGVSALLGVGEVDAAVAIEVVRAALAPVLSVRRAAGMDERIVVAAVGRSKDGVWWEGDDRAG